MRRFIIFLLPLMLADGGSNLFADEVRDNAIKQIEESGGTVRPLAANDERVVVGFNFVGDDFKDEMLAPVAKLTGVYELRLDGTPLTNAGLAHIESLKSVTHLHLEKTKIDDGGLAHLKGLENLEYLNLYGTAVTDVGLDHLAGLKNLKKLFVWRTQVTDAGAAKLKGSIPELTLNMGWEQGN